MFSFRLFILLSLTTFFLAANVLAQTIPTQSPQVVQPQMQFSPVQQGTTQQQPIQAQPIKAPLFGTQGSPSVYQQNPNLSQPVAQPAAPAMPMGAMPTGAPIRVASSNPTIPAVAQEPPPGGNFVGRAVPENKIIPFFLNPAAQQELDEFLARWERYSADIKRYDVNFNMFIYDSTIPGAQPNKPHKITFGYFKYNATPKRFVYVIEGEWQDKKQIKRDGDKNPHIFAEKVIIDEKTVFKYDYNAKTMIQINVPPEMIGKGIADSPLPLIFGAKADELKRRFSMKVVTVPDREDIIWLHARPLLIEDQQEFKELEILLDKKNLTAKGLRQRDINDKAHKVFELQPPVINPRIMGVLEDMKAFFTPTVAPGWKHEVMNWVAQPPPPASVSPQPLVGNPQSSLPPSRNEIPLYRAQ